MEGEELTKRVSTGFEKYDSPSESLSAALSQSDTYASLVHLFRLRAINHALIPLKHSQEVQKLESNYAESLRSAINYLLPITLLPQALSHTSMKEDVEDLVLSLMANLKLPSLLSTPYPTSLLRSRITESIKFLRGEDGFFEEASANLAQTAAAYSDELADAHNRLLPDSEAIDSPADLASSIKRLRSRIDENEATCMHMDDQILYTRHRAVSCLQSAYRLSLQAVERDTLERATQPSSDEKLLRMLQAKTKALSMKLRLMQAELNVLVYTPDVCESLGILSERLAKRKQDAEKTLEVERGRLELYQSLGSEFEELVVDFRRVRRELENKKWSQEKLNI